jgi:hypothetical protein
MLHNYSNFFRFFMVTVAENHPYILGAGMLIPGGAFIASNSCFSCPKAVTVALLGTSIYAMAVGKRVADMPSRLVGCGRVVRIIKGATVAFGLFYKISELIPDNESPFPMTFWAAAFGSFAVSYAIPFAQDLYHYGRNRILINANRPIHSDVVFI